MAEENNLKELNKIEKSILGTKNKIAYDAILFGKNVPDGKYKVLLKAKKKISGAYGFREVEKYLDYHIDYKYPIPDCKHLEIIPFFKIDLNINSEKYSVDYAYNINVEFDDKYKIDGAQVDVKENGTLTSENFEAGNTFETYYVSKLPSSIDEEKIITTDFLFKYHDFEDNVFKREKEIRLSKQHTINNAKLFSYKHIVTEYDSLPKVYRDSWEELDTASLEDGVKNEETGEVSSKEEVINNPTFQNIKFSTLPYVPKTKRKRMTYKGREYNFFYEIDGGPFYRSRIFKRKIGNEIYILKRYDSVPIKDDDTKDSISLLSIDENLQLDKEMIYNKYSDTMALIFDYKFKNHKGDELKLHEIDYAHFELYDENGRIYNSYDMKNNSKIELYSLPIGLYTYKIITHNDYCIWNDNILTSDEPLVVKPNADEVISSSYMLTPSFNKMSYTANISWEIYAKDIADLSLYVYDITDENETKLVSEIKSPRYNNATINSLSRNHKYRYYFSFNSNNCIFPADRRISMTDFVANSPST